MNEIFHQIPPCVAIFTKTSPKSETQSGRSSSFVPQLKRLRERSKQFGGEQGK